MLLASSAPSCILLAVPSVNRIAELRRLAGLTQEGLARKANMSVSTIQKLESGQFRPRLDTALQIARALRVSVDDLFGEAA